MYFQVVLIVKPYLIMYVVFLFSMEECEALCSRLSIMIDGRLRCLGTLQHLRDKYGSGYTIKLVIDSERSIDAVVKHLYNHLARAQLKYRGNRNLVYEMKIESDTLAEVFGTMESIPKYLGVRDYSINQNTLDNVSTLQSPIIY